MKQTERLLKIINLLRKRRTVFTAKQMADKLDVSVRTVYRDIQKLEAGGIPIEGEAGVGYRLLRGFDMPPLMFDADEVEALLLGVRMVRAWSDEQLASSANSALNKILGVLPQELKELDDSLPLTVPVFSSHERKAEQGPVLRQAIKARSILQIAYVDARGCPSERRVWPLGLFFWGSVWTLLCWCNLRNDYRTFRIDRIEQITVLSEHFETHETLSQDHYLSIVLQRDAKHLKPEFHK
jgi:predicted DNA-binding transcriptional regulator YafY